MSPALYGNRLLRTGAASRYCRSCSSQTTEGRAPPLPEPFTGGPAAPPLIDIFGVNCISYLPSVTRTHLNKCNFTSTSAHLCCLVGQPT